MYYTANCSNIVRPTCDAKAVDTVTTSGKRAYFTIKKTISIVLILLIMYMLVGFFFWAYVTSATVATEGQAEIFSHIQPVIDFFKPATDFFAWVFASFGKLFGQ